MAARGGAIPFTATKEALKILSSKIPLPDFIDIW